MRDGEDEGRRPVLPPQPGDDRDLDTPNCPDCLLRMEVGESVRGDPYWSCTGCGLVLLA